jgi:nitroimidazol reductase NimA-like FMN-containing flavoprotein (pyridoxamine 5'-phosphate oxidase superfamily)
MQLEELIKSYLPTKNVMQLATCADNQPYAVNLHYYSDDKFNIYWISTETRRHSLEINKNNKACAVIKIHENTEDENWVIGISIEGEAELLGSNVSENVAKGFQAKLNKTDERMKSILDGSDAHRFYVLRPKKITLFDSKSFSDDPRKSFSVAD